MKWLSSYLDKKLRSQKIQSALGIPGYIQSSALVYAVVIIADAINVVVAVVIIVVVAVVRLQGEAKSPRDALG